MTCQKKILRATHRHARELIQSELDWRGGLYSNNQNLQMLMYFEAFRQTAYATITDGGCNLAIDLMAKVIEEMREAKKAERARGFNEDNFRRAQDRKIKLEDWNIFTDIPHVGEVSNEDDDELPEEEQPADDGWVKFSPFVQYKPASPPPTKKIVIKPKT